MPDVIRTLLRRLILLAALALALPAGAQDATFGIDTLNGGLGPLPDGVERRSPRATIASFLRAAEDEDWPRAAHLLDLASVAPGDQPAEGARRARMLHEIMRRTVVLDWSVLTDRPDALQVRGGDTNAQAGEPRRSILLRDLDLDPAPSELRLSRVAPADGDPAWVFDRASVADIPALRAIHGPSALEDALPPVLLEDAAWGLMWWELIGLPILLAAAILTGWLVHRSIGAVRARIRREVVGDVLRALSMPLILISVTTLVWWATRGVFVFSGRIDLFLSPLIAAGFVTALLLLIVNVVEVLLDALIAPGDDVDLTDSERDEARTLAMRLNAGKRILVVVVFLLGVGVVMSSADLFRGLGLSFLASAGALTLVLAFAARNVLGNVMASLQIALNRSARVGDRVVFKGELCHVERIHLTFVQLRDWDGTRVIVPVEEFVSETFSNWSLQEPEMLRILKFKLDPRADVAALRAAFLEIFDDLAGGPLADALGERDDASVNVAGQDVFGIDVWFSLPCASPNTSWEVACAARERLVARGRDMEAEGGGPVFPEAVAGEAA